MNTYRTPDGRTYPSIGEPCKMDSGVYICLDVSLPNRPKSVRWFKRELLTVAESAPPIAEKHAASERPAPPIVIEMTEAMLRSVVGSHGVDIRVVEKPALDLTWLKYAPLFITPNNLRVYWSAAEVELNSTSGKAA